MPYTSSIWVLSRLTVNEVLDTWWKTFPSIYEDLWHKGISGTEMLALFKFHHIVTYYRVIGLTHDRVKTEGRKLQKLHPVLARTKEEVSREVEV